MAVNVDAFGVAALAELLAAALERLDAAPRIDPSIKDIEVDSLLLEAAQKHLAESIEESLDD